MARIRSWLLTAAALATAGGIAARGWMPGRLSAVIAPAIPRVEATEEEAPEPAPSAPPLREIAPEARAGEPYTVELMEAPEPRYGATSPAQDDAANAAIVEKLGRRDVVYDPALGRAARELANQQSLLGGLVPHDIVDFLLKSAGAVDRSITQSYAATSGDGSRIAREQIEKLLEGEGEGGIARVGIGEVWIPGAKLPRVVAVILSRRAIEIDPAPRRVEPGEEWVLGGVLPRDQADPNALVLRPDGRLEEVPVALSGRRFRVVVPAGAEPGTLQVSVGAKGPLGHAPLLQVPVEVGRALPDTFATHLPPDESSLTTAEAAEALALQLLNADRARFGLPALVRDERLDAIARAHSADMRDNHFFGHRSPRTGEPGDRLGAAGYRAVAHAENIAMERSIHAAEVGLLASLGHRRNILSTNVTRVGIGVARRAAGKHVGWHLTQLFARPVERIDEAAEVERLRAALDARRVAAGLPALAADPALDRIAREHARAAAEGKIDTLARSVLDGAKQAGLLRGHSHAWIRSTPWLGPIEAPPEAAEGRYGRVGIGVLQLPDDPHGMTGVVLVFTAGAR